jgi:hypothetical protein
MKKLITSLALGVAFAASASAAVIINEQFNNGLADNATIIGSNGSSGTPWAVSGASTNALFDTTSLSGTGPWATTSGGAMQLQVSTALNQQAYAVDNTGDRYFSLLFRNDDTDGFSGARILFEAFGSSGEGYGVNIDFNSTTGNLAIFSRAGGSNFNAVSVASSTLGVTNTFLIVGKFVATGNGTTTIWINPTSFTDDAALTSSSVGSSTTIAAVAFVRDDGVAFRSVGAVYTVDSLMLGNNLADVIPSAVPEPSAFAALAGLGALGFAALRRRRA